ncbi:hypothetical protein ACWGPQ_07185 [Saccharomonospora azurea]
MTEVETYEMLVREALVVSVAATVWSHVVGDERTAKALTALSEHITTAIADATVGHMSEQRLRELRADVDRHPHVRVALGYAGGVDR